MHVRYRELSVSDPVMKQELLDAVDTVLTHGRIILGPEVGEFEKLLAEYCNRKYAVGIRCGTDALYLGLRSLGIGQGDEVITTPLSWIATLNSITMIPSSGFYSDNTDEVRNILQPYCAHTHQASRIVQKTQLQ